MTLSTEDAFTYSNGPRMDGVFIKKTKILLAKDSSGEEIPKWNTVPEIALTLELEGRKYPLTIGGALSIKDGKPSGWASARGVAEVFHAAGVKCDLIDSGEGKKYRWRLPADAVNQLVGKEILILEYRNRVEGGKSKSRVWNKFGRVLDGQEKFLHRFRASLKDGWPKDYISEEEMKRRAANYNAASALDEPSSDEPVTL